jgi:hypothetical protein
MNEETHKALWELLSAAEDTVPVFDGLTNHGWVALHARDRRDRLQKAIVAMRETMNRDRKTVSA